MTLNPYLMGGSSIISFKSLMVFTGTDPEYSVKDYLNATAKLILKMETIYKRIFKIFDSERNKQLQRVLCILSFTDSQKKR